MFSKIPPLVVRVWLWWVRRSSSAVVRFAFWNTETHSRKGSVEVSLIERRSYRSAG